MIYDMYKFDFTNMKHYDIIINTNGLTSRKIYNILKKYLKKEGFL